MHGGTLLLLIVIAIGIFARSPLTVMATVAILILHLLGWHGWLHWAERHGVNMGLFMLTLAMLAPFATGKVGFKEVYQTFVSVPGLIALAGGVIATNLNKQGIELLHGEPQIIVGMILGSLLGIVFFGGVPVGPLMAGGLTALALTIYRWLLG
ncbi:DUF441 domain-containing protein [Heliorestis acidaminivorans]|uniref:UPF0756 membrane protein F9B85_04580 n=1 Tax=Heliorestis acidaminivorans TaxID=553427 RepID=A0A6I0EWA4_9FIRM|nr:DUF441 domain-containing protein [Heliorestis acidaminivorans]KAB2953889.1 DUF441 domain-containing protein [Heliorestis acidaminivorans]